MKQIRPGQLQPTIFWTQKHKNTKTKLFVGHKKRRPGQLQRPFSLTRLLSANARVASSLFQAPVTFKLLIIDDDNAHYMIVMVSHGDGVVDLDVPWW